MHNFCMTFLYNLQVGEWGVKWDKENSGTVIILEKTNRGMNPPFASEGVKHGCAMYISQKGGLHSSVGFFENVCCPSVPFVPLYPPLP